MSEERERLRALGITGSRFRTRDWAREASMSVLRHPARSVMTAIGTVLGAAAFVATLGISSTLAWQVSDSFDIRRATEVRVVPAQDAAHGEWQSAARIAGVRRLNGVVSAGARITLQEMPVKRRVDAAAENVKVMGADPGALAVMDPHLLAGRLPDEFHEREAVPVVLLPQAVAARLDISSTGMAVFIEDRPFTVIGIFDNVERRPEALLTAIVPATVGTLLQKPVDAVQRDVLIETAPGAAQLISEQAPLALRPEAPTQLRAISPPDPRTLRQEVEENVTRSSLILSVIALAVGAASIANAATASIAARTPEIGLRRAIGGRRIHVFAQLLGETTVLGALGGLVGVLLGVVATAVVSLINRWTPVLDLRVAVLAVVATSAVGLVAGLWPAFKATKIEPVAALQR